MDDLISRSDAIGAVKEERFPIDSDYAEGFMAALDKVEWILKEWLPSAQPETHDKRTETHACDLISRQAAIDAVMEFMPSLTTPDGCGQFDREIFEAQEMFVDIGQALNELPTAQPDLSGYSDKLWQKAYERGRAEALDEIVRCKDCKWFHDIGCAIRIVDDSDKPSENDYCSFAERRTDD